MNARLWAVGILILLIGLPIFGYYFFFEKSTSWIKISLWNSVSAKVELRGTFSSSWFPLLDRALYFSKDCFEVCEFFPVPPAKYQYSVTATGFSPLDGEINIEKSQQKEVSLELTKTLAFSSVSDNFLVETLDDKKLQNDDLQTQMWENFFYIATDKASRKWVYKIENTTTSLGMMRENNFIPLKTFPFVAQKIDFFPLYETFVVCKNSYEGILLEKNLQNSLEATFPSDLVWAFVSGEDWNIVTKNATFFQKNNEWKNNIRFTHFYDFDAIWRAGFIDKENISALELGNYVPEDWSVFVLLNRKTGEVFEVARGLDISEIFSCQDSICFHSWEKFYSIKIPQ